IALFLSHCCLFQSWGSYGEFGVRVCSESNVPEENPASCQRAIAPGRIRCRGAVIAEHKLNFGPIPIGEREICSECDAVVEVFPGALQIAELSTRKTALIENLRVVWIKPDQGVEIGNRARPI